MFCRSLFVVLAIVLFLLLLFTDSDYPFGIFKLFLHSFEFLRFWRMTVMEQELITLPGNLSSPSVLNGVRVPQSLVIYVVFYISVFLTFI